MNNLAIKNNDIKYINVPKCNFIHAVYSTHQKIMECHCGDIVCIKNKNDFNIINSLEKVLKYDPGVNDSNPDLVTSVSIDKQVKNERLLLKEFILDVLSSIRITAYTDNNLYKVTSSNLFGALFKTLVSREVKYLVIKNINNYATAKHINGGIFEALKYISISTGVIVVLDHDFLSVSNNINS